MMSENDSRGASEVSRVKVGRRKIIQDSACLASTGVVIGLAGCVGGGNNESSSQEGASDDNSSQGNKSSSQEGASGDNSPQGNNSSGSSNSASENRNFEWWNYAGNQSPIAKEAVQNRKNSWESNSGTQVGLSIYGYSDINGSKWRSLFDQGRYPPVIDNFSIYNGPYIKQGYIKPMNEWIDWFSNDIQDAIEWTKPILEQKNSGLDASAYSLPWGVKSYPFIVRMDHWKEAGLNPDEFPPTSYDDLVEKAGKLKEDGPGKWSYQIVGSKYDVADTDLPSWTIAEGGEDGLFINEGFDDVNIDNQTWIETFRKYIDLYREHEYSSPASPTASDEDNLSRLLNGSGSMQTQNIGSHPTILNRSPELAKQGDVKYGKFWGPGVLSFYSFSFTTPPDGTDPKKWRQKQKSAVDMIENQWLSKEKQQESVSKLGMMPIRKDTWESTEVDGQTDLIDVESNHINNSSLGWRNHPELTNLLFTVMPPNMQEALKGNVSADEALKNAAKEIRNEL